MVARLLLLLESKQDALAVPVVYDRDYFGEPGPVRTTDYLRPDCMKDSNFAAYLDRRLSALGIESDSSLGAQRQALLERCAAVRSAASDAHN